MREFRKLDKPLQFKPTAETYQYKGYVFDYYADYEPDNRKYFHSIYKLENGMLTEEKPIDWSPYSIPTEIEFQKWVDLGMPGYDVYGHNFDSRVLEKYTEYLKRTEAQREIDTALNVEKN